MTWTRNWSLCYLKIPGNKHMSYLWIWSLFIILGIYWSCENLVLTLTLMRCYESDSVLPLWSTEYFNYEYVFIVSFLNVFLVSFSEWLWSSHKVCWAHNECLLWSWWPLDHVVSISYFPVISLFFLEMLWDLKCIFAWDVLGLLLFALKKYSCIRALCTDIY